MSKNENIKKVSKYNKENYVIMYQHVKIYRTYKIHVSNSRYSRACCHIKSKPTYFEKNMAFIAPFFRWRRNDLKRCQIYTRAMRSPIKPHNVLPERSFLPQPWKTLQSREHSAVSSMTFLPATKNSFQPLRLVRRLLQPRTGFKLKPQKQRNSYIDIQSVLGF